LFEQETMAEQDGDLVSKKYSVESDDAQRNRRIAIRYVRSDITANIIKKGFLKSTKIRVKLLDISSKGALISGPNRLTINNKVKLQLIFQDGKKFTIPATIVHKQNSSKKQYGLKFVTMDNDLGEHLLLTQSDLIFR